MRGALSTHGFYTTVVPLCAECHLFPLKPWLALRPSGEKVLIQLVAFSLALFPSTSWVWRVSCVSSMSKGRWSALLCLSSLSAAALHPSLPLTSLSWKSCCSYSCWAVTLEHLAFARREMIHCPAEAGKRKMWKAGSGEPSVWQQLEQTEQEDVQGQSE